LTFRDFRSYLTWLESNGEVARVKREVDRNLELSSVAYLIQREKGKVAIFEKVKDASISVVSNVFINKKRIADSLAIDESNWRGEFEKRLSGKGELKIAKEGLSTVERKGEEVDLRELPIPKHFEKDAAPFITSGVVIAKHPLSERYNLSVNRLQLKGKNKLGIAMFPGYDLEKFYKIAEGTNKPIEVSIVIGAPPAVMMSAAARQPDDADELKSAASLQGEPLEVMKCTTVDIMSPANYEIMLEGYIQPGEKELEGPMGEIIWTYSEASQKPIVHVTALRMREKPLYYTIISGSMEEWALLAATRESLVANKLIKSSSGVKKVELSTYMWCIFSIDKSAEGEQRNAILAALTFPWYKYVVAVDQDVDISDRAEVMWAIATRTRPDEDLIIVNGLMGYALDPSANKGTVARVGIDATMPLGDEKRYERKRFISSPINLKDYL
jgi:2,5-furandicarboxylate decarboxylase 1